MNMGLPEYIRSEFIEKNLREWLKTSEIKTLYIDPGSPWQNGFIESFNARLREECLNREQLWTLTEARVVIEDWRRKYNNIRPHRSLGYITPLEFANKEITNNRESTLDSDFSRAITPSFRPSLDILYNLNINQKVNPFRLTHAVAQFG